MNRKCHNHRPQTDPQHWEEMTQKTDKQYSNRKAVHKVKLGKFGHQVNLDTL